MTLKEIEQKLNEHAAKYPADAERCELRLLYAKIESIITWLRINAEMQEDPKHKAAFESMFGERE